MIEEAIKIGLAAGVAVVFFVAGIISTCIAMAVIIDLIALPFRAAKKMLDSYQAERRWKSDPIFSRFNK